MSVDAAPQTKAPAGRFPFLLVVLAIVMVVGCGLVWMERSAHEKEITALRAEILQVRTEAERLKYQQRSREHEVAAKSKTEPHRGVKAEK
jgi:hypothetical protein